MRCNITPDTAEQCLIEEWHWTLHVEPGQPAAISYVIDGSPYTLEGAVKLVRDFEAAVRNPLITGLPAILFWNRTRENAICNTSES